MTITDSQVLEIANLARLGLADAEVPMHTEQLNKLLTYFEQISAISTEDQSDSAVSLQNKRAANESLRTDEAQESIPRELALANAPAENGSSFLVPGVL